MKLFKLKLLLIAMFAVTVIPFLYFSNVNIIEVTHIKKTSVADNMEVSGIIEASESIPVSLSYPVYIDKCYVKEDSYVNKGQLMLTLDTEKMEDYVKEYNLTQQTDTSSSLDKSIFVDISPNIYASESGIVQNLTVYDGALILSDENMCTIESDENKILKITINQEDYSKIKVGDKIEFSSVISPDRQYTAYVINKKASVRKEASVLGKKTVIDVFARIDNYDDFIVTGLEVTGTVVKQPSPINILPFEYINQDENGEYVSVYNPDTFNAEKVYIETGAETENGAEIITQFEENTLFVKNNNKCKGHLLLKYEF